MPLQYHLNIYELNYLSPCPLCETPNVKSPPLNPLLLLHHLLPKKCTRKLRLQVRGKVHRYAAHKVGGTFKGKFQIVPLLGSYLFHSQNFTKGPGSIFLLCSPLMFSTFLFLSYHRKSLKKKKKLGLLIDSMKSLFV